MPNSKNRSGSSEKPQKSSPATPHKLKIPASVSDSVPSPNRASRTPKDKSPKVVNRRSPRSPASEKKGLLKVSELESHLSHLQEELKKTKDLLTSSELTAKQAQEEAEVAKNELASMSAKLDLSPFEENPAEKLEATQNQHSSDLNALMLELNETLSLVKKLKCQLSECEKSESRALELLTDAQVKLEMAKTVEENLITEGVKAEEAYKLLSLELEKLRSRAGANEESDNLQSELFEVKAEVEKLKLALDSSEKSRDEENIQSTLLIKNTHEQVEHMKAELAIREVEMGAELEKAKAEIEELKAELLTYKENKIDIEVKRLENENKVLKAEMERRDGERNREKEAAAAMVESAQSSDREALMKIGNLTEEADKSNRKAARVVEQLEAVQGSNAEMEAELRRLKVQSDQWRKAAEAAAAMVSSGYNGKLVERTGSFDKGFNTIGSKLGSPFSEDLYDESPKKKNGNMLRKLGVLLKKGQK